MRKKSNLYGIGNIANYKFLLMAVCFMMFFSIFGGIVVSRVSYAGEVVDSINYGVGGMTSIGEEQKFTLTLTPVFTNVGLPTYPLTVELGGNDFQPSKGVNKKTFAAGSAINFDMIRIGNGNALSITLTDSSTPPKSETVTLYIDEAPLINGSSSPAPPKTREEKDPDVILNPESKIQTLVGGQKTDLFIPLEALKKTALNVKVTLDDPSKNLPFDLNDTTPWASAKSVTKNGDVLKMPVKVSPLAKAKTYPISLKVEYENVKHDKYEKNIVVYVKIENDAVEPILGISFYKFTNDKLNSYGGKQAVVIRIKNSGTLKAQDVRVTAKGFSPDGIRLDGDMDTKIIPMISAGSEEIVYFKIKPSETAKTSEVPLNIELTYDDEEGNEYKRINDIYVPIAGQDGESINLEVSNIKMPETVESGKEFEIEFDITNKSGFAVNNVELGMTLENGFVPASKPKLKLSKLSDNEVVHHSFRVLATDDLKKGYYNLYVTATYKRSVSNSEEILKEYTGIRVDGKTGRGRPKVLVKDYSFDGESVLAGEEFDLNLTFFNTSSSDIIKNMKVSVSSDDGVFSLVDSASSFFVDKIDRKSTVDTVLKLKTKKDAAVKTYNLKLVMEYEDGQGNAYDSQEQPYKEEEFLGIHVSQPNRLEIGDIQMMPDVYVGMPANVEVEFYNMGRSDMYNMFVKLKGDFDVQEGKYFVGNFTSGSNEYYSGSFMPTKAGDGKGKLLFEFEDALGNPVSVEKEFNFMAMDSSEMGMGENGEFEKYPDGNFEGEMGDEFGGNSKLAFLKNKFVIGGIIVVVIIGGILFIRHRKKKKKAMLEALEDEDE